jgi:hypothetical protein
VSHAASKNLAEKAAAADAAVRAYAAEQAQALSHQWLQLREAGGRGVSGWTRQYAMLARTQTGGAVTSSSGVDLWPKQTDAELELSSACCTQGLGACAYTPYSSRALLWTLRHAVRAPRLVAAHRASRALSFSSVASSVVVKK